MPYSLILPLRPALDQLMRDGQRRRGEAAVEAAGDQLAGFLAGEPADGFQLGLVWAGVAAVDLGDQAYHQRVGIWPGLGRVVVNPGRPQPGLLEQLAGAGLLD